MTTPRELISNISEGKFKAAYYLFGTEDYRIVEAEKFLARQFLPDLQLTTNYREIDARLTSRADLTAELASLPMLGERQVFAVSNFQHYSQKDVEQVLKLLSPPDPNRVVIFRSPSSKAPKKNSAFYAAVSRAAEPVEFKRLTDIEMRRRITFRLQKNGINIEPEALRMLTGLIAGDSGGLESEIVKLLNYKEKGDLVEVADIEKISAGFEVYNIFELGDFVVAGETSRLIRMVRMLIAKGNNPVTLVTLLQQHFICLYLVKNGRKPLPRREFLIPRFRQQAAGYDNERLQQIIIDIAETDAEMRRTGIKQPILLEMLLLRLAGERK
ncbi:MAG: DNA polymerase III subunit delta [candidate division Zixibacteria bacterium]|nr:DNA polymerase III subunit delta [candidate division Zixibacteria bacterium]